LGFGEIRLELQCLFELLPGFFAPSGKALKNTAKIEVRLGRTWIQPDGGFEVKSGSGITSRLPSAEYPETVFGFVICRVCAQDSFVCGYRFALAAGYLQ
jgi:hypothetical protein